MRKFVITCILLIDWAWAEAQPELSGAVPQEEVDLFNNWVRLKETPVVWWCGIGAKAITLRAIIPRPYHLFSQDEQGMGNATVFEFNDKIVKFTANRKADVDSTSFEGTIQYSYQDTVIFVLKKGEDMKFKNLAVTYEIYSDKGRSKPTTIWFGDRPPVSVKQ